MPGRPAEATEAVRTVEPPQPSGDQQPGRRLTAGGSRPAAGHDTAADEANRRRLLADDGPMGRLIAAKDWCSTPLGPLSDWDPVLWTALRLCLESRFPMGIFWGPD